MCRAATIVLAIVIALPLTTSAAGPGAERQKAEILATAASLFRQLYVAATDKPLRTFDKLSASGPADSVIYWFDSDYVVRLTFTRGGSLARVELFPEALLYSDSWSSVPDAVRLGAGEMQQLISAADKLKPVGDAEWINKPPDFCTVSGPNWYCSNHHEFATVSPYYRLIGKAPRELRDVRISYKQSVTGIVSEVKAISAFEEQLKIGSLWYRLSIKQDEPVARVGSVVNLTTFGCAGNELVCGAELTQ